MPGKLIAVTLGPRFKGMVVGQLANARELLKAEKANKPRGGAPAKGHVAKGKEPPRMPPIETKADKTAASPGRGSCV